jgi:hypothetical protein
MAADSLEGLVDTILQHHIMTIIRRLEARDEIIPIDYKPESVNGQST